MRSSGCERIFGRHWFQPLNDWVVFSFHLSISWSLSVPYGFIHCFQLNWFQSNAIHSRNVSIMTTDLRIDSHSLVQQKVRNHFNKTDCGRKFVFVCVCESRKRRRDSFQFHIMYSKWFSLCCVTFMTFEWKCWKGTSVFHKNLFYIIFFFATLIVSSLPKGMGSKRNVRWKCLPPAFRTIWSECAIEQFTYVLCTHNNRIVKIAELTAHKITKHQQQ